MSTSDPMPLPDDAQLARLNDALDARLEGRLHRVPGTVEPDNEWLDALIATRDLLRADIASLAPTESQRAAAVAAAMAHHVADTQPAADHSADHSANNDVAAEPTRTASVIRPARWQRQIATVSAAAAALLVVAVATLPRLGGNDADSSADVVNDAGGAVIAADGSTRMESGEAPQIGDASPSQSEAPAATIEAIVGPASAPLVIDSVDALRQLADSFAAGPGTPGTDSAVSVQATATAGAAVPGFDCPLSPAEIVLAEVSWQGSIGVAVLDTASGVVRVVDMSCTELVVAP
ncbi:MAG: hypothetical protein RJB61_132 [Actinomycetota bacterium]